MNKKFMAFESKFPYGQDYIVFTLYLCKKGSVCLFFFLVGNISVYAISKKF